jgi:hypothetical protein
MSDTEAREIVQSHGLRVVDVKTISIHQTGKKAQEYEWALPYDRYSYLKWFIRNIDIPDDDAVFYDGRYDKCDAYDQLLLTPLEYCGYEVNGTLDMTIRKKRTRSSNPAFGMRVGIDIRKTFDASDTWRTYVKAIAANQLSQIPTVLVLTDLRQRWQFIWLLPGVIMNCIVGLNEGVALLEAMAHPIDPNSYSNADPNASYLRRCCFKDAISNKSA